jgi:hypothetical protein
MDMRKVMGICALIIIIAVVIGLTILMIVKVFPKDYPSVPTEANDSHLSYNGYPITNAEAKAIGNISREEINKKYPSK